MGDGVGSIIIQQQYHIQEHHSLYSVTMQTSEKHTNDMMTPVAPIFAFQEIIQYVHAGMRKTTLITTPQCLVTSSSQLHHITRITSNLAPSPHKPTIPFPCNCENLFPTLNKTLPS
jgi:hypothetical protein